MTDDEEPQPNACCESRTACIFTKALLARAAVCELAQRRAVAEREAIECPSPVARTNCGTLYALLHERARFTLRLPGPGQPLIHAQALRLQCAGLQGMQRALAAPVADVHRMVGQAHDRHGSLTDLPWASIVQAVAQWQPHRSRRIAPK